MDIGFGGLRMVTKRLEKRFVRIKKSKKNRDYLDNSITEK